MQTTDQELFTYQDILDTNKRGGACLPIDKKYDVAHFWNDMGSKWYNSFDRREKLASCVAWFVDRLKSIQVESVLEVGCGFGRILPFLIDAGVIKSAEGLDISESILKSSEEYLTPSSHFNDDITKMKSLMSDTNVPKSVKDAVKPLLEGEIGKIPVGKQTPPDYRDKIKLFQGDARQLNLSDNYTECVLSCELLQHLSPVDLYKACAEMKRVSSKYIICAERWAFPSEHFNPHIWSHDIAKVFSDLGCEVLQVTTAQPGLQGLVIKK